jgi:transcriptional regulator with XRE-family HTH domain
VHRNSNVIGPAVAKYRYRHGWTQDDLVAKLQILGCNITRDILANIETRRSIATDTQIEFFVEVFGIDIKDLFPPRKAPSARVLGVTTDALTRRRGQTPEKDEGVLSGAHH